MVPRTDRGRTDRDRTDAAGIAGRGLRAGAGAMNVVVWLAVLTVSAITILNGLPIITNWSDAPFVIERPERTLDLLWRTALVCHIAASSIAIAIGPLLVWNLVLRKSRTLHRRIGWIYVAATLSIGAPTGLYLAFFSKGGAAATIGFLAISIAWIFVTLRGLHWIVRRNVRRHAAWMGRSYAITLSAVFFRVIQFGLYETSLGNDRIYVLSVWGSLFASLIVGELFAGQLRREGLFCRLSFTPRVVPRALTLDGPDQKRVASPSRSFLLDPSCPLKDSFRQRERPSFVQPRRRNSTYHQYACVSSARLDGEFRPLASKAVSQRSARSGR